MRFDGINQSYERGCDNSHYTGKYREVAHCICNLRYKSVKEIPVVFPRGQAMIIIL